MIQIQNLYKAYNGVPVLDTINLNIRRSEIFGIVGQSGAGKSTLLRCINGLESFDNGQIVVNGTNISLLSEKELSSFRRKIGMIFQNFALLNRRTVIDNVMLPMECWHYPKEARRKKAQELLELVGLADKTMAMPHELSGGQKQRVAIARALTLEPDILLCDEATSALDPAITKSILELLADVNRQLGITVVIVTHDMAVIKAVCNRMAIVSDKRIAAMGDVADTFLDEPPSLLALLGKKELVVPPGQAILKLSLRDGGIDQAFLHGFVSELKLDFTIIAADVEQFYGTSAGHLYLRLDAANLEQARVYCLSKGMACTAVAAGGRPGGNDDVL
ncbi:MAG TPA: ABC transporter ATP-binding protein [Sporomusaceae bacterium]|uniref:methionine ABC transporter ATP-binding protein n=1 Tax=Anaerospora sp. TaxID=1960278 RepID=UPI000EED0B1E|nr:ATP-binding cassette domain-containing protein [Anaerospora sp.]HAK75143.1 ABC transporter ATP-binding protein [Sporomusaceae bacterium]